MSVAANSIGPVRISAAHSSTTYGVMLFTLLTLWPSVWFLQHFWWEIHDYRHGFLIAAVSAAWVVVLRGRIDARELRPQPVAAVLLAGAVLAWLIAFKGSSALAQQLLIPPILWLAVLAAVGGYAARLILAPVAYLYFAVPLWDHLVPVLQRLTVIAAERGLALFGVPAIVGDFTVTIPDGTFEIAGGCSGKRYFMVAMALAYLAAAVFRLRLRRGAVLIVCAAGLALVANWLRVITVIYAGYATHMQHYLVSVEHLSFGSAIFAVLLLIVIAQAVWISRSRSVGVEQSSDEPAPRLGGQKPILAWLPIAVLLIPWSFTLRDAAGGEPAARLGTLPVLANTWQGPLPSNRDWRPHFAGHDDEVRVAFDSGDGRVEVYLNIYGAQQPGRELVYYVNTVLTPDDWHTVSGHGIADAVTAALGREPATLVAFTRGGDRWVVGYIYKVGSFATASPLLEQLYYGARTLTADVPSGVVAFATRCNQDCDAAHRLIARFWEEQGRELLSLISRRKPHNLAIRQ